MMQLAAPEINQHTDEVPVILTHSNWTQTFHETIVALATKNDSGHTLL